MKKLLILTVFLIVFVYVIVGLRLFSKTSINNLFSYSYCDQPVSFRVDTVDLKFNLSKSDFLSDINQAVRIWNNAIGKSLFIYDPKGKLSVNLIYDERQSLNNQVNQLKNEVKSEKQALNPEVNEYQKLAADFKQKLESLNSEIQYWNERGGAPFDQYNKLIKNQQDLQEQSNTLNSMAQKLNVSTRLYNSQVNKLNKTIETFNNVLEERPEEGVFDGPRNRIEIYFNINNQELVHTLAHEFGHALGIRHISNPSAIMYFKTSQKISLSGDDINALMDVCKKRSYIDLIKNMLNEFISKIKLPEFKVFQILLS